MRTLASLETKKAVGHEEQIHFFLLLADELVHTIDIAKQSQIGLDEGESCRRIECPQFVDDSRRLGFIAANQVDSRTWDTSHEFLAGFFSNAICRTG